MILIYSILVLTIKTLTKEINKDLKSLVMWLTANKISLNNDKPELIYFHLQIANEKRRSKISWLGRRGGGGGGAPGGMSLGKCLGVKCPGGMS